jgi:hypothetical protein
VHVYDILVYASSVQLTQDNHMSAMDKVSSISRDNVSSINHGIEEQKLI